MSGLPTEAVCALAVVPLVPVVLNSFAPQPACGVIA